MHRQWVLQIVAVSSLLGVGCSSETEGGPGQTLTFLISDLGVGAPSAANQEIVPGFNLDKRVSDTTDVTTCGRVDFTSPPPDSEPGVDNQLGPLLSEAVSLLDVSALIRQTISNGNLLVLLRVSDVNDFVNDDSVDLALLRAKLPMGVTPAVDGEGTPIAGQTFPIDASTLTGDGAPLAEVHGHIRNGRFSSDPLSEFAIPVRSERLHLHFDIAIRDVQMRFDLSETAISDGVLGGSVSVDETAEGVRMYSTGLGEIIRPLLTKRADLDYGTATGECASISAGMVFGGVPAIEGEPVSSSQ